MADIAATLHAIRLGAGPPPPGVPVADPAPFGGQPAAPPGARPGGIPLFPRTVTKLRMEGVPRFPSKNKRDYKFHHFAWDFEGAMVLLGLRDTLVTPLGQQVSPECDAKATRSSA